MYASDITLFSSEWNIYEFSERYLFLSLSVKMSLKKMKIGNFISEFHNTAVIISMD